MDGITNDFQSEGTVIRREKPSEVSRERESEKRRGRLQDGHSAVESDINALEHTGLDRCPDRGKQGYDRYAGRYHAAFSPMAANLHPSGMLYGVVFRRPRVVAALDPGLIACKPSACSDRSDSRKFVSI